MKETVTIAQTREKLTEHRALSLARRIGRRMIGDYPSREDRKRLKRYEKGPFGRIADDTAGALNWTKRLNRTTVSHLGGELETAKDNGTVLMSIKSGSEHAQVLDGLFDQSHDSANGARAKEELRVGLFDPGSSPELAGLGVGSGVGVYLESSTRGPQEKVISRQDVEGMAPDVQQGLERLVSAVEVNAHNVYKRNMLQTISHG